MTNIYSIYLHQVESCDSGRKNIAAPTHLKSFDNPEGKGYLDDSPGSSIKAGGSDSDLDSDRLKDLYFSFIYDVTNFP